MLRSLFFTNFAQNSFSLITVQKNLWKIFTSSFESICNGFSWMKIDYNGRKFSDLFRYENDFDIIIIHFFFVKTKSMETHYYGSLSVQTLF